jgi:FKBP-type peptidyl-prolyl cis-trans isomerase
VGTIRISLIGSTYSSGGPTLFTGTLLPGVKTALMGQKVGSRILAVLPPQYAYGSSGDSSIGVSPTDTLELLVVPPADGHGSAGSSSVGIEGTDTLVFVVDVLGAFDAS